MWKAFRAALRRIFEPGPTTSRKLEREARAAIRAAPPSTVLVLVEARYLPHGGDDRLELRLGAAGGRVERLRTPLARRGPPQTVTRELLPAEAELALAALEEREAWTLPHHRESLKDGLICAIVLAQGKRTHAIQLHCGGKTSPVKELLQLLLSLAPVDAPAPFAYTTPLGKLGFGMVE